MYPKEQSAPNNPYCLEEISMSISNLPNIPELKPVFLEILSDGKVHKFSDIVNQLADHFSLTAEELNETIPSGFKRFYTRVGYTGQTLNPKHLILILNFGQFLSDSCSVSKPLSVFLKDSHTNATWKKINLTAPMASPVGFICLGVSSVCL